MQRIQEFLTKLRNDPEFKTLLVSHKRAAGAFSRDRTRVTVGIASCPKRLTEFARQIIPRRWLSLPRIRKCWSLNSTFRLRATRYSNDYSSQRQGAIARFLDKFGEGIQQVEIDVTDVDRATEILRARFKLDPIYPATRSGANGTRVNFFLVTISNAKKVLVELVEQPNQ